MNGALHQYEQIDEGVRYCLRCDHPDTMFCAPTQISVAKPDNHDSLQRELDAIARQLLGIAERLKRLRATG